MKLPSMPRILASAAISAIVAGDVLSQDRRGRGGEDAFAQILKRCDKDGDGRISAEEYGAAKRFKILDRDGDGFLTPADFGGEAGGSGARAAGPATGAAAPDFSFKTKAGDRTVTLSSFAGKRPVALIFGSYT